MGRPATSQQGVLPKERFGLSGDNRISRHSVMAKTESDIKSFHDLSTALAHMPLEEPPVILLSGEDGDLFDMALEKVRHRLAREAGSVELTVLSGEQGDEQKLLLDLYNIPLFAPYRIFVVRQAHDVLKSLSGARQKAGLGSLPPRTLLLLDWRGRPPAWAERLFGDRCLHLSSREVYDNRMLETVLGAEKRVGVRLTDEARDLFVEAVERKEGAIERALVRLRERLPKDKLSSVSAELLREILLPDVGFDVFALVDALFARDFAIVERELARFHPNIDNYFAVLKIMLSRADELRRCMMARHMGMSDAQVAELIGIKNRPPFIQKKILSRLAQETSLYGGARLLGIYDMLIDLQHEFRSRVPLHRQSLVFSERVREVFMGDGRK